MLGLIVYHNAEIALLEMENENLRELLQISENISEKKMERSDVLTFGNMIVQDLLHISEDKIKQFGEALKETKYERLANAKKNLTKCETKNKNLELKISNLLHFQHRRPFDMLEKKHTKLQEISLEALTENEILKKKISNLSVTKNQDIGTKNETLKNGNHVLQNEYFWPIIIIIIEILLFLLTIMIEIIKDRKQLIIHNDKLKWELMQCIKNKKNDESKSKGVKVALKRDIKMIQDQNVQLKNCMKGTHLFTQLHIFPI